MNFAVRTLLAIAVGIVAGFWIEALDAAEESVAAADLVLQLGASRYADRIDAEQRLTSLGMDARHELLEGLSNSDPQIQRTCRRILIDVLHADHQRRLEAFVADENGEDGHGLAGWERYKSLVGTDKAARELFAMMHREEAGLLESAEAGAAEAIEMRLQDVRQMLFTGNPRLRHAPPLGMTAALVFTSSDPRLKIDSNVIVRSNFITAIQQGDFGATLKDGEYRAPARALLAEWIRCPSQMQLIVQSLRLAVSLELNDAGLDLALDALKQRKTLPATYVASAIEAVGRFGGKNYAALLDGMLSDERMCTQRVLANKERREIQVRDVALGWLIHLTGQKLDDYNFGEAKKWFDTLKRSRTASFNYSNFVFTKKEDREAALKRWAAWVKENPLPDPPKTQGSGRWGAQGVQKRQAGGGGQAAPGDGEDVQATRLELAEWDIVRALKYAERLAAEGRPEEAAVLAGNILAAERDYFYQPERGVALFRPLKAGAEQLLARLPESGRAAYELHYGALASQALNDAIENADPAALARVDRDFFFTRSGAEAAYLLGCYHRIAGRYVQAAVYFNRLRTSSPLASQFEPALSLQLAMCWYRIDMQAEAQELLQQVLASRLDAVDIGGELYQLRGSGEEILARLETSLGAPSIDIQDWRMFRGDISGNRIVQSDAPYLVAPLWAPLVGDDFIKQTLLKVHKSYSENRRCALLTLQPVVVDGAIVTRTPTGLRCIDLHTGELRWVAPSDNGLVHLLRYGADDVKSSQQSFIEDGLRQRFWEDPSFGTLSSDGKRVYVLEDRGFVLGPGYRPIVVRPDGKRQLDVSAFDQTNLLVAYDVETGKLLWELGGSASIVRRPLAGGKFLGPPLPLGDLLYAVVEFKDQTRLAALDAVTGRVQSQWLLEAPDEEPSAERKLPNGQPQNFTPGRGISPVHAGGMILSITATGRLVAVDLASRTVRWTFKPPRETPLTKNNVVAIQKAQMVEETGGFTADQWSDPGPLVAGDYVLLTPLGENKLHCLNLHDGKLAWSADRKDGLYVAGVGGGRAIVVGRGSVRALRLRDGKSAWPSPVRFPAGASPSGRGYVTQDRVLVPLDSAEVVAVDLQQGNLVARSLSPEHLVPGNLIPLQDMVVSVGLDGVRRFETLGARYRRLGLDHVDAGELARLVDRAELLLYQGQTEEAVRLLQQARAEQPSTRASELLSEAMLQSLRGNWVQWEHTARELASAIRDPKLRVRFHEELASVYRREGRLDLAWQNYLQLIDAGLPADELVDITPAQTVQRSLHIQQQLSSLWESAGAELRGEIDRQIAERAAHTDQRSMLRYFEFHPAAQRARLSLAAQLATDKRWMQAELLLRTVLDSGSPQDRAEATARLADVLQRAGQPLEAARFYEQLRTRLADTVCREGQTGAQIVAGLPADSRVASVLDRAEAWPVGPVHKEVDQREASKPNTVYTTIPLMVSTDSALSPFISVDFNMSKRLLIGYDAQGAQMWQVDLTKLNGITSFSTHSFYINEGRMAGHLLVIWLGQQVIAIDPLAGGKVLWKRETIRLNPNQIWAMPFIQARLQARMFGRANQAAFTQPLIVTPGYAAFQQGRMLVAVDPFSGDTLWLRDDMPPGADLAGDERAVLVTPQGQTEAIVLNAIDGSDLGKCKMPAPEQRLCTHGRRVITWQAGKEKTELRLQDPWKEKNVWERAFAADAQSCVVAGGAVAVLEPSGAFVVLSCETGRPLVQSQLPPTKELDSVFVTRNDRRYIVIANGPPPKRDGPITWNRTLPGFTAVEGRVCAINAADGKPLWSTEISNQWFKVNYPPEAPVLTFFKRDQKAIKVGNNSWRSDKPSILLKILDARNGAILHESTTENSYEQNYALRIDPEKHEVHVDTRLQKLTLRFEDSPRDDESGVRPAS